MGHVVDFVPNHMGIGTGNNARWNDLLENGPSSPAAIFFDVDWSPAKAELQAKLLLPILGDQYGQCARARRAAGCVRRRVAGAALLRADTADQRPRISARLRRCDRASHSIARRGQRASERVPQHHHVTAEPRPLHRSRSGTDCGTAAREGSGADAAGAAWPRRRRSAKPSTKPSCAFNGTPGDPIELRCAPSTARGASLSAGVLADGVARNQLPPVLRHQHARRAARREHGSVRGDAPAARGADSRREGAGGPDRSSRRAVRSARDTS